MMSRIACLMVSLALLGACSFERRSAAYTCDDSDDCGPGRGCDQGWCVEIATGGIPDGGDGDGDGDGSTISDGSVDPDVPFVCPPECTSCDLDGTCNIVCTGASSCATQVLCPPGIPCKVECNGDYSCMAGIDCSQASRCRIECSRLGSCGGLIACGEGACQVECTGADSCAAGTDCADSCACSTLCEGAGSCALPPTCPSAQCTDAKGQCTTTKGGCITCSG